MTSIVIVSLITSLPLIDSHRTIRAVSRIVQHVESCTYTIRIFERMRPSYTSAGLYKPTQFPKWAYTGLRKACSFLLCLGDVYFIVILLIPSIERIHNVVVIIEIIPMTATS